MYEDMRQDLTYKHLLRLWANSVVTRDSAPDLTHLVRPCPPVHYAQTVWAILTK